MTPIRVTTCLLVAATSALTACDDSDSCFVAGTQIATPEGPRSIEELAVGDLVWSWDLTEKKPVARPVTAVFRSVVREIRSLRTASTVVRGVTPSHPVYQPSSNAYGPVRELGRATTLLCRAEEGLVEERLLEVTAKETPEPTIEVFNLEIQGPEHNYFADGILVHNKSANCDPAYMACGMGGAGGTGGDDGGEGGAGVGGQGVGGQGGQGVGGQGGAGVGGGEQGVGGQGGQGDGGQGGAGGR